MAIAIRRFAPDEWRLYRDLRLRALADSPDSFGSTYAREASRAERDWKERLTVGVTSPGQLPVLALIDDVPAGLAWGRVDDNDSTLAELFQVWVAPDSRRKGVGRQLIDAVIEWAQSLGVHILRLGVTPSHPAALQLYRQAGFVFTGKPEPLRLGSSVLCHPMHLALNARIPNGSASTNVEADERLR
jgi:GNAT superfamily N-acetyltransferase